MLRPKHGSSAGKQANLFDTRRYTGTKPQVYTVRPPTGNMTVAATLPAYHAHLSATSASQYTPDDFTADIRRLAMFCGSKRLSELQTGDLQQWIGQLKQTMPPKTVSRKVSALGNYFRWLMAEQVLEQNPAAGIRADRVSAPLPDLLYESECERLLTTASGDPRTYLLILLLLETGLKKAELLGLDVANFDFSNRYQPELWVRHSGRQVFKDRKVKLPMQVADVFDEYVERYRIVGQFFPYSPQFVSRLIGEVADAAGIRKQVTAD
jgi:site-specific recombinase XerD